MISDQLKVLCEVLPLLERLQAQYMVSGSMAVNVYATPRMTRDVDIVVDLRPESVDELLAELAGSFYVDPQAVRDAVRTRDMFNAIHLALAVKLDFIVCKESEYRRLELSRRRRLETPAGSMWVVSPEDLILSKLAWSRTSRSETQLADVRNLITSVADLDWAYLERWAEELRVAEQLAEVRP